MKKIRMNNIDKALSMIGYDSYEAYYEDRYEEIRDRIDHEYFYNPLFWAGSRHIIGFDFYISFSCPNEDEVSYKVTAETYHRFKRVAEKYIESATEAEAEAYLYDYTSKETIAMSKSCEEAYNAFKQKVINGNIEAIIEAMNMIVAHCTRPADQAKMGPDYRNKTTYDRNPDGDH